MSLTALTEKEREAQRLLLRGHDAKSCARELGLSVHTINERLRDARRKLGVTSSREAARMVSAAEPDGPTLAATPKLSGDRSLGAAPAGAIAAQGGPSTTGHWVKPRFALPLIGVAAMSAMFALLLLPASPLSVLPVGMASGVAPTAAPTAAAAADAAEAFLALVDQGRWAESYAATGGQFRKLNTLARWSEVSERVRPPLGKVLTRELTANEYVPAPPEGYRLVKFRSAYQDGTEQSESLSLAWEDGAWKVVGITFE